MYEIFPERDIENISKEDLKFEYLRFHKAVQELKERILSLTPVERRTAECRKDVREMLDVSYKLMAILGYYGFEHLQDDEIIHWFYIVGNVDWDTLAELQFLDGIKQR